MTTQQKDVIYIDIDDEITSIIDKLRTSQARIVAMVLPKRATMLQSSVNMKLLKKAAADDKKHLVLITGEAGLLPLAGSIGIHVAKTLQSKPEIPEGPGDEGAGDVVDTIQEAEVGVEDFDPQAVADQPVGDLAGLPEPTKPAKPELTPRPIPVAKNNDPDDTIVMDNTAATAAAGEVATVDKPKKVKKDKNLKVPNFNKFRLRLIIGAVVVVLLLVGLIVANIVLPKATVTIATNTSSVNSSLSLAVSTSATSLNTTSLTVPAHLQQTQKSTSQQVPTTGQKNEGTAATGTVTMTAQECAPDLGMPANVPAGSGISINGLTYITQADTTFSQTNLKNNCANFKATSSTAIAAQGVGTSYNLSGTNNSFNVSGRSDVSATGSASGGTDNNVQVVSQTDITNATQKLTTIDTTSIKSSLETALQQAGYYALSGTFSTGTPTTSSSANVGDQASTVTVTQSTTYTMLGVHSADLQTLLDDNIDSQIDTSKQSIQDDGFSKASFSVASQSSSGAQVTMQATATAGPMLSASSLKTQVAGKKPGDVISSISSDPGVTSVKVHLSPFWVSTIPSKTSKITITFQKSSNASGS